MKFNSKELQQVYNEELSSLKQSTFSIDEVSQDIRELESFLHTVYTPKGSTTVLRVLIPDLNKEGLRWEDGRIKYVSFDSSGKLINKKNLIECPSDLRITMHRLLPMFLKEISKNANDSFKVK